MLNAHYQVIQPIGLVNNRPNIKKMEEQFTYDNSEENTFSVGNPLNLFTANKLTYVGDLKEMFGYADYRAVEKFLRDNNIPVFKIGRKKYAVSLFIDAYIQREIKNNLDNSFTNSEDMLEAISNDDIEYLTNLTESKKEEKEFEVKYKTPAPEKIENETINPLIVYYYLLNAFTF